MTSNSTDFTQTRDQIITDALVLLGVYRPGATVSSNDLSACSNFLNKMIKAWIGKGIHMWEETDGTLFLRTGVNKYSFPNGDNAGDNVIDTSLTATASSTSLTVSSTVGMTAGDYVGIQLDAGTRQWTTIVSVNDTSSLTITTGLTSTASSGNSVSTYTTSSTKALSISSCQYRTSDLVDLPIDMRGRDEFMSIPQKTTQSSTVQQVFYYPTLTGGTMYVYPTPDNCAGKIKFSYQKVVQDFDSGSDLPDFPSEWLDTITLNLAVRLSKIYGKKSADIADLRQDAALSLLEMELTDITNGSIRIVPRYRDE